MVTGKKTNLGRLWHTFRPCWFFH